MIQLFNQANVITVRGSVGVTDFRICESKEGKATALFFTFYEDASVKGLADPGEEVLARLNEIVQTDEAGNRFAVSTDLFELAKGLDLEKVKG